jgi:hypothetical protein
VALTTPQFLRECERSYLGATRHIPAHFTPELCVRLGPSVSHSMGMDRSLKRILAYSQQVTRIELLSKPLDEVAWEVVGFVSSMSREGTWCYSSALTGLDSLVASLRRAGLAGIGGHCVVTDFRKFLERFSERTLPRIVEPKLAALLCPQEPVARGVPALTIKPAYTILRLPLILRRVLYVVYHSAPEHALRLGDLRLVRRSHMTFDKSIVTIRIPMTDKTRIHTDLEVPMSPDLYLCSLMPAHSLLFCLDGIDYNRHLRSLGVSGHDAKRCIVQHVARVSGSQAARATAGHGCRESTYSYALLPAVSPAKVMDRPSSPISTSSALTSDERSPSPDEEQRKRPRGILRPSASPPPPAPSLRT